MFVFISYLLFFPNFEAQAGLRLPAERAAASC